MGLSFGNLLGLWALLGIPAVLLIHFLQKERREVVTSTLFLLEDQQRESKSGIRLERLRNSLPLWLQILAVLLLTWILAEPRWLRPDSFQRVVLVLDSSASMSAFRAEAIAQVKEEARKLSTISARTDWILTETDLRRGTLYSGDDLSAFHAALETWQPLSASHSAQPALERGRGLLRQQGDIFFITSHPSAENPPGVTTISVGHPIPNCGFIGLRIEKRPEGTVWKALARNYSDQPQTRQWETIFENHCSPPRELSFEPGQTLSLSGHFPPGAETGYLKLSDDAFTLDDWMPLARPQPKPLAILVEDHPALGAFAEPFLTSLPAWTAPSADKPEDLRLASRLPSQTHPARPGIYFLIESDPPSQRLAGSLVAENHRLMRELNWQGLLIQATAPATQEEGDQVLLWQGDRPLIVLRNSGRDAQLLCNFDLRYSNAARLPAFVILLHRFIDEVREAQPTFSRRNLQTAQLISTGANPLGSAVTVHFQNAAGEETEQQLEAFRAVRLNAPDTPGFWKISQGEQPLLQAAVHFADSREADFRAAASSRQGTDLAPVRQAENFSADFLTPVWLLLLGSILLFNWRLTGVVRRKSPARAKT